MSDHFTCIELVFYPEHVNFWLCFGEPDERLDLDRRRSLALFGPSKVFGYVRWRANEYGTQDWRVAIVRTGAPSWLLTRLEGVHPGGEILLSATGKSRVKRALAQLDALEEAGFELAEISPAYYRQVHNRIAVSRPTREYSDEQHRAFKAARAVQP